MPTTKNPNLNEIDAKFNEWLDGFVETVGESVEAFCKEHPPLVGKTMVMLGLETLRVGFGVSQMNDAVKTIKAIQNAQPRDNLDTARSYA